MQQLTETRASVTTMLPAAANMNLNAVENNDSLCFTVSVSKAVSRTPCCELDLIERC